MSEYQYYEFQAVDRCLTEEEFEPCVPLGLQNLNPALTQLADFLRIDFDLINAAAQMRPSLEDKNKKPKKRTVGQLLKESKNVRQTRIQLDAKTATFF